MRAAVFLDRDDTLIENATLPWAQIGTPPGDLCDPSYVRLLPGVPEALLALAGAGYALVVVSNQGLVARGVGTLADVDKTNARLSSLLQYQGKPLIERFYVCPYHPKGCVEPYAREHPWRKPAPGMILAARDDLGLDLTRSWMVGDAIRDVEAGRAAGIPEARCLRVGPALPLPSLLAASRVMLGT